MDSQADTKSQGVNPIKAIITIIVVSVSTVKGKPTNSEFIALIADKLQLQLKSSEVANF